MKRRVRKLSGPWVRAIDMNRNGTGSILFSHNISKTTSFFYVVVVRVKIRLPSSLQVCVGLHVSVLETTSTKGGAGRWRSPFVVQRRLSDIFKILAIREAKIGTESG